MSEVVIVTLINVLIGGFLVKLLEYIFGTNQDAREELREYRRELLEENQKLRSRLLDCEDQIEKLNQLNEADDK